MDIKVVHRDYDEEVLIKKCKVLIKDFLPYIIKQLPNMKEIEIDYYARYNRHEISLRRGMVGINIDGDTMVDFNLDTGRTTEGYNINNKEDWASIIDEWKHEIETMYIDSSFDLFE